MLYYIKLTFFYCYRFCNMSNVLFSLGCLWCSEYKMSKINGVISVIPCFTPSDILPIPETSLDMIEYKQNGSYRESVYITYEKDIVSYEELIWEFLLMIDPSDEFGSFSDRGFKYTSAIHINEIWQHEVIERAFNKYREMYGINDVKVRIINGHYFYPIIRSEREFANKNKLEYKKYYDSSGRDNFYVERDKKTLPKN